MRISIARTATDWTIRLDTGPVGAFPRTEAGAVDARACVQTLEDQGHAFAPGNEWAKGLLEQGADFLEKLQGAE